MSKKLKILIAVAVLVTLIFQVVSVVFVVNLISGGNKDYVFYLKNRQLYCSDFSEEGNYQLTDDIFKGTSISTHEIGLYKDSIGSKIYVTKGIMFYPDECKPGYNGVGSISLYYKRTGYFNTQPVLIDKGVTEYYVSDDGNLVTYKTTEKLCQYSLITGRYDEISSIGVRDFVVSDDGEKIMYLNSNSDLYCKVLGKKKEKLDEGVNKLHHINEAINTVYYEKYNTFYKKEVGKDSIEIATGIGSIKNIYTIYAYDSGEAYYLTRRNDALEGTLWYFDGEKSVEIGKSGLYLISAKDKSVMIYEAEKTCIINRGKVTELGENVSYARISDDGKTVYCFMQDSVNPVIGDLYKIKISGDTVSEPKLYDTGIVASMNLVDDDEIIYYKQEGTGEKTTYSIYCNKEKIDSNVHDMQYIKETGEFVYITDWDYENNWGTLKIHDGKAKKIAENVCFFDLSFDGDVVFITDYKANFREGVLYAYNGKKTVKIDEEVNCILPIYREDD